MVQPWKGCVPKGTESSNLSLTASIKIDDIDDKWALVVKTNAWIVRDLNSLGGLTKLSGTI